MTDVQLMTEAEALKAKLKATWEAGDFAEIAKSIAAGAEEFVAAIGLKPGTRVLDVACGNGNTAIPAAKQGAIVTGIDLVPYLVDQAVTRAAQEGVEAKFEVGDAEALPYAEEAFDAVITMFGAMFAPRPEVVAAELMRVCRSGGTVAMANWTPSGFIGQMFKVTGKQVPPPALMPSPLLWGDEATVRARFADQAVDIVTVRRDIAFNFPFGPKETVEHFRRFYGPTQKAFQAIDAKGQSALREDLEELWSSANKADDGTTYVLSEYLEVRATKK